MFIGPEFMEFANAGIRVHANVEEALASLAASPLSGHLVLVKGSRGTRLETLTPAL
jgi:UDP-N-acetylmuramyl pentapeptide synthase